MRLLLVLSAIVAIVAVPATAHAEGLIHRLPEDGTWARFEITGTATEPDGAVQVTVQGTQTIRSVGQLDVEGEPCRWIELEMDANFNRTGSEPEKLFEYLKLLIPEKRLKQGENPREHVLKAYKGPTAAGAQALAPNTASLDEFFHAPLEETAAMPAETIKTNDREWTCEGTLGQSTTNNTRFVTRTRVHPEAPFGVVTYSYEKHRFRGDQSQGMRTMAWKLVASGTGAKSIAPDKN
ncbi:MAG: hypothetical protein WDZ59_09370 [Pirellulales bacterium]